MTEKKSGTGRLTQPQRISALLCALLFFVLRSLGKGRKGEALAGALPLLLLGTFLLGPVMAGRYIYPFVCSLPVAAAAAEKKEG